MVTLICKHCGSDYPDKHYRAYKAKYCNFACYNQARLKSISVRFWEKVEKSDGCWLWKGHMGLYGYGLISRNAKTARAHRVSYELTYGEIPEGKLVLHRCDNRACVRPDHLFIGTQSDNIRDMDAKGRRPKRTSVAWQTGERHWSARHSERVLRGEAISSAVLTESNVRDIRELLAAGESKASIARGFGVTSTSIKNIAYGKTWAHVT